MKMTNNQTGVGKAGLASTVSICGRHVPRLRPSRFATARDPLLLAVLVLAFACVAPHALAGFDEGVAAYNTGDFKLAYEEFLKAADQGYATAQFNLALMYYNGRGVPRDYQAAARWYRKAADQGNAKAQYNLGQMVKE